MAFREGYQTGAVTGNPIEGLLSAVNKKFQERNAQRAKDAEDEKSLTNELVKLTAMENVKSKYKQQEQLTEGLTKGTVEETTEEGKGTFEGTPFGEVGKRYKPIKKTADIANPEGLDSEQQVQARALAKKIYGVRGAQQGLPAVYEEMRKGKSMDEIEDNLRFAGQSPEFKIIRPVAQNIMAGKSIDQKQSVFDDLDDLRDEPEQQKQYVKRLARTQASAEESRFVVGKERTIKLLDEIQGDLNNLESIGIDTNIFTGTAEEVAKKAGTVVNPEARKTATKISTALQSYRRSMTGVQFGMPENIEYKDMFPNIGRTKNFNSNSIKALQEVLAGDLDNFYSLSMGEENYNSLFGSGKRGEQGGQKKTITLPSGKTITIGQ